MRLPSLAIVLMLAFVIVPTSVDADEPASQSADEWTDFENRLDERQRHIHRRLDDIRLDDDRRRSFFARLDGDDFDFCSDFDEMDALVRSNYTGVNMWQQLWSISRPEDGLYRPSFVSELLALVEDCEFSRGALYRAAFILDYMYWNRMIDRVDMEVADGLEYRDYFYELKIQKSARKKIAAARRADVGELRTAGDFLEAPEMGATWVLKTFGNLTTFFPPSRRRAFMAVVEFLDLREDSLIMFGSSVLEVVDEPDDLALMVDFYDVLIELQQDHRPLGEAHGGWTTLMEMTDGDEVQAIRVVGLLASLRTWILEEISDALLAEDALTPEILEAFYAGANAYFLMNQLDERAAVAGDDPYTLRYHYFYPPDYESTNWKVYHWFANAHLGCQLARRGKSVRSTETAIRRLAEGYEALTLNMAMPTKREMEEEPRARAIIEGWEDVDLNGEGGVHGWQWCES